MRPGAREGRAESSAPCISSRGWSPCLLSARHGELLTEVRKGKSRKSGPSLKFRLIQHYWGSPRVLYGFWERSSVPPLSGRFSQVRAREGGLRCREYPYIRVYDTLMLSNSIRYAPAPWWRGCRPTVVIVIRAR